MREAGDVCFADVFKDGSGVCEYVRYEDMKYALKKLDDSKFRSHEVSHIQKFHFGCRISTMVLKKEKKNHCMHEYNVRQCQKFGHSS